MANRRKVVDNIARGADRMKESKMNIVYLPIDSIKPYERNPRNNDKAVEKVKNSIEAFGWQQPIVVDKDNVIIVGHTRWKAAKELGQTLVPCQIAEELTDEEVRAYRIADNKVSELSEWDEGLLDLEMLDINIDMSLFGFDIDVELNSEKKVEREKTVKAMELKAFEHHDYIVFVFNNQMDWLNAVQEFGLERVDAGYGKTKKIGLGRVIDGKRLLEKVGHPGVDTESGQSE